MRGRKPGGGKEWAEAAQLCRAGPHAPAHSLQGRREEGRALVMVGRPPRRYQGPLPRAKRDHAAALEERAGQLGPM